MDGTDLVSGRTYDGLLDAAVRARPDAVFISTPDGADLTFAQFAQRVAVCTARLADRGTGPGDRVLLAGPTSVEQLVTLFALYRLRAVAVLTNPANTAREIGSLMRRARVGLAVIGDRPDLDELPADIDRVLIDSAAHRALFTGTAATEPPIPSGPEQLATIVTTSGTSAEPKLVGYTHGNHVWAGESFRRNLSMSQQDVLMHHFPLFHMSGLGQLACVIAAGARLVLVPRFRSSEFAELVTRFEPTVTFLNSTHIKMIRESTPAASGRSLRYVVLALQMPDEHYDWFQAAYGDVLRSSFGMTETVAGCITNPLVGAKRHTCGFPVPGYRMRIVDERGGECAVDEPGELLITTYSPHAMVSGYLDDDAATAEAFRAGWLHTGDIVVRDSDGHMRLLNRAKEIIKRAGENISPAEVEAALERHPDVAEAGVVGRPDAMREEVPVAFVVPVAGRELDVDELREHCRRELAAFKIPAEFTVVTALPKSSVGKLVRRQLLTATDADRPLPFGAR